MYKFDERFNFEDKTLKEYINDKQYDNHNMLSLLLISFLDLGIIEILE